MNDETNNEFGSDELTDLEISRPISEHPLTLVFRYVYEIIKTVIIVLLFALLIRSFLIQPFVVDGSSMEPTFHNQEYLMVEKVQYLFTPPERGDIIVFKYPMNPSLNYVKRVIGLPGDRVVIARGGITIYNNGYPNGFTLKEPYLENGQVTLVNNDAGERSWVVPSAAYFVLGDNRDHSDDSRSWGTVPKANVLGKVWMTVYPVDNLGFVEHAQY